MISENKSIELFEELVIPKLLDIGFEQVIVKGRWIKPKLLFSKEDVWVGYSWDWRDSYLDLNLGKLHFLKDVLPRVIVLGTS